MSNSKEVGKALLNVVVAKPAKPTIASTRRQNKFAIQGATKEVKLA